MRPETIAIHSGFDADPTTKAVAVPIYQTVSYAFDSAAHGAALFDLEVEGYRYTRIGNPTNAVLEKRVAELEGGTAALATASGQAALYYAFAAAADAGGNIVSVPQLYGATHTLLTTVLPRQGVEGRLARSDRAGDIAALIDENTRAVFCESVGNPAGNICDIEAIAAVARAAGVPLIVDNTVPTPYLIRPIEHGADIVVHSATKFLGGHGTSIGGIIVDSGKFPWSDKFPAITQPSPGYHGIKFAEVFGPLAYIIKVRVEGLRDFGPCISPFNSFLFIQGIETLKFRMEAHSRNALAVAQWLEKQPAVTWVKYPGLKSSPYFDISQKYLPKGQGSIVTFGIKGGTDAGRKLIDNVKIFSHLANLGDAKSLIIHPSSTTHQQLSDEQQLDAGVTKDLVRISVGIEDVEDLQWDLEQAIAASQA
jgi:O-acetylhomoserine (thiol)-lyase